MSCFKVADAEYYRPGSTGTTVTVLGIAALGTVLLVTVPVCRPLVALDDISAP